MPPIDRLMLATLTEDTHAAGTNNRAVMIINDDGNDVLYRVIPTTAQADLERGDANLYAIGGIDPPNPTVDTDNLTNSSVRLGFMGIDLWAPRHCFVWGYSSANGDLIPMAIETEIDQALSTQLNQEGRISVPIPLVNRNGDGEPVGGLDDMPIQGLMIVLRTADVRWAGTNSTVTVNVATAAGTPPPPPFLIPRTAQRDLARAQANMYFMPVSPAPDAPLTKSAITDVTVTISGRDMWVPRRMHIFGLDVPVGGATQATPTRIVPLVDIRDWENGAGLDRLSTDPGEGSATVSLPLVA